MDIRQAEIAALGAEGEAFVVDAQLVEDGGVEVGTWTGFSTVW